MGLFGKSVKQTIRENKELYVRLMQDLPYDLKSIERNKPELFKSTKKEVDKQITECIDSLKKLAIREDEIDELEKYLKYFLMYRKKNFS